MLADPIPAPSVAEPRPEEDLLTDLMIGYQQADEKSATELVRRLSPILFRFLARQAPTRSDTEDLVQECWLRLHRARHTYRPPAPVLPWVFAIARHARIDVYRRRRHALAREIAVEMLPEPPYKAPPPAVQGPDLFKLLDELPASQREVLLMLKVTGMSLEEVARATSTTVGAVKQKAHRAYDKLFLLLDTGKT